MTFFILYYLILIAACSYALIRGHKTERWGVAIMVVGSVGTTMIALGMGASWASAENGVLFIDLTMLLALIHLALVSDRFWPIWMTAFHLVSVSIHVAVMVSPEIAPWAYATGQGFWAYPMLLALAIGAHEYVRQSDLESADSG